MNEKKIIIGDAQQIEATMRGVVKPGLSMAALRYLL
jgi:hypothetical protein